MAQIGPSTQQNDQSGSARRFRCPVETCQRLLKSQSGWTRHIHSVHANMDLACYEDQDPTEVLVMDDGGVDHRAASPSSHHNGPSPHSSCPASPVPAPYSSPNNNSNYYEDPTTPCQEASYQFPLETRSSEPPSSSSSNSNEYPGTEYHHLISGDIIYFVRDLLNLTLIPTTRFAMRQRWQLSPIWKCITTTHRYY
jgi:hypothetical protein